MPSQQGYVNGGQPQGPRVSDQEDFVEWEASEFVQHDKGFGWLALVLIIAAVLLGIAIFFQQWTFAALIVVMTIAFGYFGFKKPRIVHYKLNNNGITIDTKHYTFKDFKSFGVVAEGAFYSIILLPVKRLSPGVNIYFSEEQSVAILNIVGDHLPVEKLHLDPFDIIMRRLRF
jgi:hypothetical protein